MEFVFGKMALITKEIGKMINKKEKELISTQMEAYTKETSKIMLRKVKEKKRW